MPRPLTTSSITAGLQMKGRAQICPNAASLNTGKIVRPGKRDRRKRKAVKGSLPHVIDLTLEHEEESEVRRIPVSVDTTAISTASRSASSEAGPSRLRSEPAPTDIAIAAEYQPTAFTPVAPSVLTSLGPRSRSHFTPQAELHSDNDSHIRLGAKIIDPYRIQLSPGPMDRRSTAPLPMLSNESFEPPDSSPPSERPTMDPMIVSLRMEPRKADQNDDAEAEEKDTLLLPSHVLLDRPASVVKAGIEPTDDHGVSREDDSLMEGLHFVDDNMSKGVPRYFEPAIPPQTAEATFLATIDQSKICQNCKRPGHRMKECSHTICMTCGAEDQHERRDCPAALVCFGCGRRGHRQAECPDPTSRSSRRQGCDRCGNPDHIENSCPSLWRIYSYRSDEDCQVVQNTKSVAEGWTKEAIGGGAREEWCYNCAEEGHLGDDCRQRRGSLARLFVPSAFSQAMSSRRPFGKSDTSRSRILPTHARWTDDDGLPCMPKGFGGDMAGRRGREKDKRRMIDRDKRSRNDEDDWFDDPKRESGSSLRRRETSNQKNTRDDDSLPKWYTERSSKQRDHLPFSHSHLIAAESASVKGISFGKLTLPDSDTRKPNKQEKPSHPLEKVNRVKRRDEIEGARRQRSPLKHGSVVGASRSKSKGNKGNHHEEHERDWEREWRASGGAGGPVIGWGRDMDREERQAKKDAARVSGQRYMGGY